jgi:hypothetical protein
MALRAREQPSYPQSVHLVRADGLKINQNLFPHALIPYGEGLKVWFPHHLTNPQMDAHTSRAGTGTRIWGAQQYISIIVSGVAHLHN